MKTKDKWISVSDKVPNHDNDVLVFYISESNEGLAITSYLTEWKQWYCNKRRMVVQYWMELPEKPKVNI